MGAGLTFFICSSVNLPDSALKKLYSVRTVCELALSLHLSLIFVERYLGFLGEKVFDMQILLEAQFYWWNDLNGCFLHIIVAV